MTDDQIKNLRTLSAYLAKLPKDYAKFEMGTFLGAHHRDSATINREGVETYLLNNGGTPCGTVACAVGHGPAAHLYLLHDELTGGYNGSPRWSAYCWRVFGVDDGDHEFDWMFGGGWADTDNTPHGAAKRINYFLEHGVPEEWTFDPEIYS